MEITVTFPGGKRVDAQIRDHVVHTDQPVLGGGEDAAPAPYELFLASLATCAGIFVLGFCQSRDLPHEGIRLTQHHTFDPSSHGLVDARVEIHVPPTFPEKYREALVRVASKCSVKRTFEAPPNFTIATVVDEG